MEEVEINGQNVRVDLQDGGYYTYSKKEIKLPEMTIQCPVCNDVEHRMTIYYNLRSLNDFCYIYCDQCNSKFKLVRTTILTYKRGQDGKTIPLLF